MQRSVPNAERETRGSLAYRVLCSVRWSAGQSTHARAAGENQRERNTGEQIILVCHDPHICPIPKLVRVNKLLQCLERALEDRIWNVKCFRSARENGRESMAAEVAAAFRRQRGNHGLTCQTA